MDGNFAIYLQEVGTQHHHLPDRNLVSNHVAVLVLPALVVEWCHEHYRTPFGVGRDFDLSVFVSDVSVLSELVKLYLFLGIVHIFDVLLYFFLVVSHVVFENEVDESVTHRCFSQNQFKFSVRI